LIIGNVEGISLSSTNRDSKGRRPATQIAPSLNTIAMDGPSPQLRGGGFLELLNAMGHPRSSAMEAALVLGISERGTTETGCRGSSAVEVLAVCGSSDVMAVVSLASVRAAGSSASCSMEALGVHGRNDEMVVIILCPHNRRHHLVLLRLGEDVVHQNKA
jgi:hypothetical protein